MLLVYAVMAVVTGRPSLKKVSQLPQNSLKVPQPNGTEVAISLVAPTEAKEKLGVWTSPSGDFGVHVASRKEKGILWASRMKGSSCPPETPGWDFVISFGDRCPTVWWPSLTLLLSSRQPSSRSGISVFQY